MAKFVGDFLSFAFLSVVSLFLGLAVISTVPAIVAPFLIAILIPALFIGPVAVLLLAAFKARPGRIIGALAGVPLLLLYHQASIWHEVSRVDSFNQRQFLASQQQHSILLIQDAYGSWSIEPDHCKNFCIQILMSTPYTVVFEENDTKQWFAFRAAHGADCLVPELIDGYIHLLAHRIVDFCAVRYDISPTPNALIIRENYSHDSEIRKKLPWRSMAYELHERLDGSDRLLGRWVWTAIEPSPWFGLMGVKESSSTVKFAYAEFYSAALGIKVEDHPTGTAPLHTVLAALEPHFRNTKTLANAAFAFEFLTRSATPQEKAILRAFIEARIAELEKLPHPPRMIDTIKAWRDRL